MTFRQTIGQRTHLFRDLKDLMAKATPLRSGDQLAGIAATSAEEMVAARMVLADQPLKLFLAEPLVPYETDEVTRLILDRHDAAAFAPIAHLTVGAFATGSSPMRRPPSASQPSPPASRRKWRRPSPRSCATRT